MVAHLPVGITAQDVTVNTRQHCPEAMISDNMNRGEPLMINIGGLQIFTDLQ